MKHPIETLAQPEKSCLLTLLNNLRPCSRCKVYSKVCLAPQTLAIRLQVLSSPRLLETQPTWQESASVEGVGSGVKEPAELSLTGAHEVIDGLLLPSRTAGGAKDCE